MDGNVRRVLVVIGEALGSQIARRHENLCKVADERGEGCDEPSYAEVPENAYWLSH
jgi:hypothetical protein